MQSLTCQKCSSPLKWDGVSELVTCQYCGTQYVMHPRSRQTGRTQTVGNGEVAFIATSQGGYVGIELCKSYIPKGWRATTGDPLCEANLLAPMTMQVEYASPQNDIFITYTGEKIYNHLEYNMQTANMQGRLQIPEHTIGLCYMSPEDLCQYMMSNNPSVTNACILAETKDADSWVRQWGEKNINTLLRQNLLNPGWDWVCRRYSCKDQTGKQWVKQIEVLVLYCYLPVTPEEWQLYQMMAQSQARLAQTQAQIFGMVRGGAGLFGNLMNGGLGGNQMVQEPQPKLRWSTVYILETSASEDQINTASEYARKIRDTFEKLPIFTTESEKVKQQIMLQAQNDTAVFNNAMSNMANEQMRSWDRKQSILQDAHESTMNTMHQMFENTAQTHQRVANLHSESIQGVNTYYTNYGGYGDPDVVKADVRWDHVYQNSQHPDIFAGKEGDAPLEFGVDFEELKRTDGNY